MTKIGYIYFLNALQIVKHQRKAKLSHDIQMCIFWKNQSFLISKRPNIFLFLQLLLLVTIIIIKGTNRLHEKLRAEEKIKYKKRNFHLTRSLGSSFYVFENLLFCIPFNLLVCYKYKWSHRPSTVLIYFG